MRRRVKKNPIRTLAKYRKRSLANLGIQVLPSGALRSPFFHAMTSERILQTFDKMTGIWRAHHGVLAILELLEQRRVEEVAATSIQLFKAIHQAAPDQGGWSLASTLLPWEDHLGREAFSGDE